MADVFFAPASFPTYIMFEYMSKATSKSFYCMEECLLYGNQSIDFLFESTDWFLYDRDLRHEWAKQVLICSKTTSKNKVDKKSERVVGSYSVKK